MSGITISSPPAPAVSPNPAPEVQTQPTLTGGVVVTDTTPATPATLETPKLAGKFNDVAALEKAYKELESKLGQPKAADAPAAAPATTPIENAGLDLNAIAEEFTSKNGVLTDKTVESLKAKGLTVDNVKTYVDGQNAIAQQVRSEFAQIAGSEEALKATLGWAKTNIPEAEAKAYDAAVKSGDMTVAKMLWQNIVNRYQAVHGKDPKLVTGGNVPASTGVQPFENYSQVEKAMSDPRYDTDESYRQAVAQRIAASPKL